MRSGRGFLNDLRGAADVTAQVTQPVLIVASRQDGGVPFGHAEALAASLPQAELVESGASSHFIWFGDDYPAIAETIRQFLTRDPTHPTGSGPRAEQHCSAVRPHRHRSADCHRALPNSPTTAVHPSSSTKPGRRTMTTGRHPGLLVCPARTISAAKAVDRLDAAPCDRQKASELREQRRAQRRFGGFRLKSVFLSFGRLLFARWRDGPRPVSAVGAELAQ